METDISCGYSGLPPELLLIVLMSAPSLEDVYALICACPRAAAVFSGSSWLIVESAIARTMPDKWQYLARTMVILYAVHRGSKTTKDILVLREDAIWKRATRRPHSVGAWSPSGLLDHEHSPAWKPLPAYLSESHGPRFLVLTAARIAMLRRLCLTKLLLRLHCGNLSYNRDPEFRFTGKLQEMARHFPDTVSYQPFVWWAPSPTEHFRVERAMWHLAVNYLLRMLGPARYKAENGISLEDAPPERRERFFYELFGPAGCLHWRSWMMEEIKCVHHCLRDLVGCSPAFLFGYLEGDKHSPSVISTARRSIARFSSRAFAVETLLMSRATFDSCWPYSPVRCLDATRERLSRPENVEDANMGSYTWRWYLYNGPGRSPLETPTMIPFAVFRRRGIGIWDAKRLALFGLLRIPGSTADISCIWRSMLLSDLEDYEKSGGGQGKDLCKQYRFHLQCWRDHLAAAGDVSKHRSGS